MEKSKKVKKYYIVWAPENGWDCIIGLYLASNIEEVWKQLASENVGDTVKSIKKSNYYKIREYSLNKISKEVYGNGAVDCGSIDLD